MFSNAPGTSADSPALPAAQTASAAPHQGEHRRSLRLAAAYLFVVLATAVLLTAQIAAQQPPAQQPPAAQQQPAAPKPAVPRAKAAYEVWEIPANLATPEAERAMDQARRARPDRSSPEYSAFQAYYSTYIFAKMTQPESRGELSKIVQTIQKDLDRATRSGSPVAADMRKWIVQGAGKLATGNYEPAVRVSATLLLGQMDDQPADLSNGRPPVPSSALFRPLVTLYRDNNIPDGVRAAALHGLHRHVRYGFSNLSPAYQAGIVQLMLQLAQSDPPEGRSPAAHAFLQRYAVDILTLLNNPQHKPQVTETLVSLSTSSKVSPLISLYAVESFGRLSKELTPVQQGERVVGNWAARAADAFEAQADRLSTLVPPPPVPDQPQLIDPNAIRNQGGGYASGGYGAGYGGSDIGAGYGGGGSDMDVAGGYSDTGYGGGGYGMGMLNTTPQPPEIIASRRKVNTALQSLHFGLTGSAKQAMPKEPAGLIVDEGAKATALQLVTAIQTSAAALNDPTLITEEPFIAMLREQAAELRKLADQWAPEAAPAEEAAPAAPADEAAPAPAQPEVAAAR